MHSKRPILIASVLLLLSLPMLSQAKSSGTSLAGTVKEVIHPSSYETHIILESKGSLQEICLGDSRFLDDNGQSLKAGDAVEVRGFMASGSDPQVFIATVLSHGGQQLTLRDARDSKGRGHHDCCGRHRNGDHADHDHCW